MNKAATILKTTLILFLITSIAAVLLAFVNEKTAPLIAHNSEVKQAEALKSVMPSAEKFDEFTVSDEMSSFAEENKCEINSTYTAKAANGDDVGTCSIITGSGYDSGLQLAVGVNSESKVTSIEIISSNETPGLGQKASHEDFRNQFTEKTYGIDVVKSGASENEINAISGATLTSNGVTRIVNTALKIAELKEGK